VQHQFSLANKIIIHTNVSLGAETIRGASLIYSSMVATKDCGGWKRFIECEVGVNVFIHLEGKVGISCNDTTFL